MAAAAPVRRRMARGWKKASIRATPPVRNKKQLRSRNIWSRELIKGGRTGRFSTVCRADARCLIHSRRRRRGPETGRRKCTRQTIIGPVPCPILPRRHLFIMTPRRIFAAERGSSFLPSRAPHSRLALPVFSRVNAEHVLIFRRCLFNATRANWILR